MAWLERGHGPVLSFFFFNDTATTEIYTLSLHDALPISLSTPNPGSRGASRAYRSPCRWRSEEHTSELQSRLHLVCRLLLEKKKNNTYCPSRPDMQRRQAGLVLFAATRSMRARRNARWLL